MNLPPSETYAVIVSPPPDAWLPMLRELMGHAAFDPWCSTVSRDRPDEPFRLTNNDICLHWSRQTEWPWALIEAKLEADHECLEVGGAGRAIVTCGSQTT